MLFCKEPQDVCARTHACVGVCGGRWDPEEGQWSQHEDMCIYLAKGPAGGGTMGKRTFELDLKRRVGVFQADSVGKGIFGRGRECAKVQRNVWGNWAV